jgi:polyferredoxin
MLGYVGAIAADFVTLKLLVGWARSSVPWEFAPGLVALGAFALLAPAATGRPAYCLHVCPHGAAQEWIQRITPWRWEPRPALARLFGVVPLVLAAAALVAVVAGRPIDLAELEPFSAYDAGRQAVGIATVVIAAGGLLASAIVPKAYCRFGCPTGAVLEYVRVSPAKVRLGWRDALLASVAILVFLFTALSPT